jgi:AraC-like DNA-binding protein
MVHAVHLKDVAGSDCRPVRAVLPYAAPAHAHRYAHFLECPVEFGASVCELHYDRALLARPSQFGHKLTSSLLLANCDQLIGEAQTSAGAVGSVRQHLNAAPGRLPSLNEVAQALGTHERTLRRKLVAEGTSFAAIADGVRASRAIEHLRAAQLPIDEIAARTGFSDAANFRRAFKRWTGKSPREFSV